MGEAADDLVVGDHKRYGTIEEKNQVAGEAVDQDIADIGGGGDVKAGMFDKEAADTEVADNATSEAAKIIKEEKAVTQKSLDLLHPKS